VADDDSQKEALPAHVEKALADAREVVKGGKPKGTSGGRWLALIPVSVAVLFMALLMPRTTEPRDIPMPSLDGSALRRTISADRARASAARATRLPGEVLAVGSAIRAYNRTLVKSGASLPFEVDRARNAIDEAKQGLGKDGVEQLIALRAIQLEEFLAEVSHYESTGEETNDLIDLGSNFITHMRDAGWMDGRRILLDDTERRCAYKLVWNTVAGLQNELFALTLDEERALYTLYIARPHVPDAQRESMVVELSQAHTPEECRAAQSTERRLAEMWRADKIQKLARIDPSYPAAYALGVAYYRAGRYETSVEFFRKWLDEHPDGAYAIRARNHLRAALEANGSI
jgi:hypothetical protein